MTASPATATSPTQRIVFLDGWRGLAILTVLAGHFVSPGAINAGRLGVELFFVLSGRLMADVLFVQNFPLKPFLFRRVSRVWPGMIVFVAIIAALWYGAGPDQVSAIDVVRALTYTLNYYPPAAGTPEVFGHLWSLCVEEWSYVILAIVALVCRRWKLAPAPIIFALAAFAFANGTIRSAMGGSYYEVFWRTDTRSASILFSCALFLVMCDVKNIRPWFAPLAGVLGFALSLNMVPDMIKYTAGTMAIAFAVATIDRAPSIVRGTLSSKPFVWFGLVSFSVYIWQQPFFNAIGGDYSRPLLLVLAIAAGVLSYLIVEQPARRAINARLKPPLSDAGIPSLAEPGPQREDDQSRDALLR